MQYWLDTEFIEDGRTIEPLSIGVVAEDGREYYAEVIDVDWSRASDWVRDNVLGWLDLKHHGKIRSEIAHDLFLFFGDKPEIWGYYCDYDWVLVCQLYGRMIDLPKTLPHYCLDVKQYAVSLGNPGLPAQSGTEHHALEDARWTRTAYDFLRRVDIQSRQGW